MSAFASPGSGKKPQVRVFDKHTARSFIASTENVFAQRDFNTHVADDGAVLCLEDGMGEIEAKGAPVLRKIREERSLAGLSSAERETLCVFVALQKVRGVALRAQMGDMIEGMRQRIRAGGQDPDTIPQLREDSPDELKFTALQFVRENLQHFAEQFLNKTMLLQAAPEDQVFYLGDAPVVWDNANDTGPYGNLGLSVVGIEIYLPIAPDLLVAFWCPTILESWRHKLSKADADLKGLAGLALLGAGRLARLASLQKTRVEEVRNRLLGDVGLIEQQSPIELREHHVRRLNALQISQSERYLVSSNANFDLAKELIAGNEGLRRGLRAQFG